MLIALPRFEVLPGERQVIQNVTWTEFESIVEASDRTPGSRIAYLDQTLEVFMPLAEHEDLKEILSDLLKALMEELDIEFRSLGIEIDITSRTYPQIYAQLQVPELWQFENGQLSIKILENGKYLNVTESPNFPGLNLITIIPHLLKQSETIGRNTVIKSFRQWIRSQPQ